MLAFMLLFIPAAIFTALTQARWYNARYSLFLSSIERQTKVVSLSFQGYVKSMGNLGLAIGDQVSTTLPANPQKANEIMRSFRLKIDSVSRIAYISPEGIVLAGDPADVMAGVNLSDREYFRRIRAGEDVVLSEVLESRFTGQPAFGVWRAIRDNGRLRGAVLLGVDADQFVNLFGSGEKDEALILLDQHGVIAYHSRHPNLSWKDRVSVGRIYAREVSRNLNAKEAVALNTPLDINGWLGDWQKIPGLDWTIGFFEPERVISGVFEQERRNTLIWAALTLGLIGLIAWYTGTRLSLPARKLAETAREVEHGNYNARSDVRTQDEIGLIAGSFNRMIGQFQSAWSDLKTHDAELQTLYELSRSLSSSLVLDEVIQSLLNKVFELMSPVQVVELFLVDQDTRELAIRAQVGLKDPGDKTRFALGEGIPGKVAQEKKSLQIHDINKAPEFPRKAFASEHELCSLLAVPIILRDEAIGVIDVITKCPHIFDQEEINLVYTLAAVAGTAIENARLYEREQRIARTLERSFAPTAVSIPGVDFAGIYRPGRSEAEIGGDFYDVIPFGPGKCGIVIADISGKGLDAAIYTSMAKYSLRAYAAQTQSPSELMSRLNGVACSASRLEGFVTVILCSLDANTGELIVTVAGHEPPMIYRADSGIVETIEGGSTAVGIITEVEYFEIKTHLDHGDKLVLFTDGVTEARREKEFFGLNGVRNAIQELGPGSVREIADGILSRIMEFSGNHLSDDVTMAVLGLNPSEK